MTTNWIFTCEECQRQYTAPVEECECGHEWFRATEARHAVIIVTPTMVHGRVNGATMGGAHTSAPAEDVTQVQAIQKALAWAAANKAATVEFIIEEE